MRRRVAFVCLLVLIAAVVSANGVRKIRERLQGFNEVPAISTAASGKFQAEISDDETAITYTLSYADLEGAVQQAHIHLGAASTSGGISVFLCANPPFGPPAGAPIPPPCPPPPGTVSGTLTMLDVIGPTSQGIAAGEFAELIAAIRAGKTYANVHTTKFPSGEIRAQLEHGLEDHGEGHR